MTLKLLTEFALMQIPLIIGIIWKTAAEKSAIYRAIDAVKDGHDRQIGLLDKNLSLLTQESQISRLSLDEKITGQGKRFGSKFDRLEQKINETIDFKLIISKLENLEK
jgi:hypothetical protein